MARTFEAYKVKPALQNKLQGMADRLAKAKALVARGTAEVNRVRDDFYSLADAMFGPDTYIIYESRAPHEFFRMSREMQEPRSFDINGLAADPRITPEQFVAVTKIVVDLEALDSALARRAIDSHAVAEHTDYGRRPNLLWAPTGARSEIKLMPGMVGIVASQHPVSANQEK